MLSLTSIAARLAPTTALFLLGVASDAAAQAGWTQPTFTTNPASRNNHVMCTDTTRRVTVMFGGLGNSDTWEYDGKAWTKKTPTTSPPALGYAGMSFDTARGVCVLFGGRDTSARKNETWEWDGKNWSKITTTTSPAIRYGHAQCYDVRRKVTVVFGGFNSLPYYSDTWEYDGKNWKKSSATGPIGRIYPAMEYDFVRGKCVLFGGYASGATPSVDLADTWEYDGSKWTEVKFACAPDGRWGHAMQYSLPKGIVLFGGRKQVSPNAGLRQDTWVFDGTSWAEVKPTGSPSARNLHAMAVDPGAFSRVVLFGGSAGGAETHVFDPKTFSPGRYEPYGAGCGSSNGTPAIGALNCVPPYINETFKAELTGIPSGAVAQMIFGLSNTSWKGANLPLDIGFMGFTSCSLLASFDLFFPMATNGTTATIGGKLPNDTSTVGSVFYNQAFVADSGANGGLTFSNGAMLVVGRR